MMISEKIVASRCLTIDAKLCDLDTSKIKEKIVLGV